MNTEDIIYNLIKLKNDLNKQKKDLNQIILNLDNQIIDINNSIINNCKHNLVKDLSCTFDDKYNKKCTICGFNF